jgi:hypothetical protein
MTQTTAIIIWQSQTGDLEHMTLYLVVVVVLGGFCFSLSLEQKKEQIPYSSAGFTSLATTTVANTRTKTAKPKIASGILKAGSEWKTAVVGKPAK